MTEDAFLSAEALLHPLMQPVDAGKLIYQRVFGCTHMLGDRIRARDFLFYEMSLPECGADRSPFQLIGGKMLRLNLDSAEARQLGTERIFNAMLWTAETCRGSLQELEIMLKNITEIAGNGLLPFSEEKWLSFFNEWKKNAFSPVSHSQSYHDAYLPHYRVILSDAYIAMKISAKAEIRQDKASSPLLIALDGPCGSGKTTLSAVIAKWLNATVVHMDDFYRLPQNRKNETGGHMDFEKLFPVLNSLLHGRAAETSCWNCLENITTIKKYAPSRVILLEGSYSHLAADFVCGNKLTVFLRIGQKEQLQRIFRRNPDRIDAFKSIWIPSEQHYYREYHTEEKSDLILDSIAYA